MEKSMMYCNRRQESNVKWSAADNHGEWAWRSWNDERGLTKKMSAIQVLAKRKERQRKSNELSKGKKKAVYREI